MVLVISTLSCLLCVMLNRVMICVTEAAVITVVVVVVAADPVPGYVDCVSNIVIIKLLVC